MMTATATAGQETLGHILVVDDDEGLRHLLKRYLTEQGFATSVAADAAAARALLALIAYDAVVLDVMMPRETGFELVRSLASTMKGPYPPILFLTAMGDPEQRIEGLETGADDYLTKPFEPRELVLRLQRLIKRGNEASAQSRNLRFGDFLLELQSGRLTQRGEPVYLTTAETQLLKCLGEKKGEPVSRETLAGVLGLVGNERSVDVQVTRLRKKIEPVPGRAIYLQTLRNAGYVLHAE